MLYVISGIAMCLFDWLMYEQATYRLYILSVIKIVTTDRQMSKN